MLGSFSAGKGEGRSDVVRLGQQRQSQVNKTHCDNYSLVDKARWGERKIYNILFHENQS